MKAGGAKGVMPDGTRVSTDEGTPQGGPLSPLLSNVVLDEFDSELQRRGLRFVRYADDCNIFVRSLRAGQRVMASIRRFLERRLRLQVNEEKSKVARPEEIHFLGFRLRMAPEGKVEVHISARTKERLDARIQELTPRNWGRSPTACITEVNRYLQGWIAYFRICTEESEFLFRHLLKCDVSLGAAAQTAYCRRGVWYKSNTRGMTQAYPDAPVIAENERLKRENQRLAAKLHQAETIIEVQKKLSEILGIPLPPPDSNGSVP